MHRVEKVKEKLIKYNCEYLLEYCNILDEQKKEEFFNKILKIDFDKQEVLFSQTINNVSKIIEEDVNPVQVISYDKLSKEKQVGYKTLGEEAIKNGKLAIVTLAGGQGTRLGHTGPKGTYMLTENKSLFEIICDKLKEAYNEYGRVIDWYIMTSKENQKDTIKFFEDNNYFNYPKENIMFFNQNDNPMNLFDGKIFLNENANIKIGADGHGGIFDAMLESGVLKEIKDKKTDWVFVTPVDNPLIELVDPLFMGIAINEKYNVMSKSVEKLEASQKSGVFCEKDGRVRVLEYTEISPELMSRTNSDGSLFLRYAHINCNMFNIKTIEELMKLNIPYHIAKKKAKYINESGEVIIPQEPNAYKYERFIFDYFPYIENIGIYNVDRKKEYEPVKSSAEKARIAYLSKMEENK